MLKYLPDRVSWSPANFPVYPADIFACYSKAEERDTGKHELYRHKCEESFGLRSDEETSQQHVKDQEGR